MNRAYFIALFILFFAGIVLLPVPSVAGNKSPINIEADRMISLEQKNSVLFSGNVDASQDDVRILTDDMTVYYVKNDQGNQKVSRIKCVGNVEVTKGEWLGTSNKMEYLSKERKIILNGNAKAWQGKNLVTGNTIVYYLDEGRSEVIGGRSSTTLTPDDGQKKPGRVKATIIPE